jgi:hypothetical protein
MSRARLVITAVVVEGCGVREVACAERLLARLGVPPGHPLLRGRRRGVRSALAAPVALTQRHAARRFPSPRPASTPGPRRSAGTSVTTTESRSRRPPSTATCAGRASSSPSRRSALGRPTCASERTDGRDVAVGLHPRPAGGRRGYRDPPLSFLDDHARFALSVTVHRRVTGPIVLAQFRHATACHGVPASTLTDNNMVFTTRFSGAQGRPQRLPRPSSSASGSTSRTPAPTARPPAARPSASGRR